MSRLRLVTDTLSHDTIEFFEALLDDARKGKCIGAGVVALYKRGEYIVNVAGHCRREPSLTIGPTMVMVDQLIMLERGR